MKNHRYASIDFGGSKIDANIEVKNKNTKMEVVSDYNL